LKEDLNKDASNFAKITLPRNFKIGGQVICSMIYGDELVLWAKDWK
jgi:hypothetical protein